MRLIKNISVTRLIIYSLLLLCSISVLVPILNLLAVSLTDPLRSQEMSGLDIIPKGFSLINYEILLSNPMILRSLFNSVFITVVGTSLNLLLTSMSAYILVKTKFPGRKLIMVFLIIIMVFEPGMIPEYLLVRDLGLIDTYWALILYKTVNIFYLFIMMRFFEDVPDSIIEAARIDGAGYFKTYYRIVLPLSVPALVTMGLFYGVYHWNEYFRATIYLNSQEMWPLQVVLRQFVVERDNSAILGAETLLSYDQIASLDYSALQAGTIIIAIVPLLIIYPFVLKYYTNSTLEGGVKD
ncbi:carbohydrate ABC transporter permease [Aquibacillus saliphilus]|uniref:carbohydrate ABC transporter permease n=1 Tax=Aquibacillus saliphilus TaxID=1909422 RepID=UPI001CF09E1F